MTVVVTCFNYGDYVTACVTSALAQEGGPPKVVVVDDGSTDPATAEALDRLPDEVTVIRQANAGVCAARNAGVRASDTPLVILVDADDELPTGALAALKRGLRDAPAAAFAYGHRRFVGDMTGVQHFPPYDPLKLLDRHLIGVTALMRREVFDATGGFDAGFGAYEDWEFWINALAHGYRGVRVDAVTLVYLRHSSSKFGEDRGAYRDFRRHVRLKHGALYARRRELAAESDMGMLGRAKYRWFWGPRPIPPAVDHAVQRLMWSPARGDTHAIDSPPS